MKKMKNGKGFIAIFLVIALLAFSLSLTTAVTYLSINESQSGLALAKGASALALTEGCAEDALLISSRDENYASGTYGYLGGTCVVEITKDGTIWTLDIVGTKDGFTRALEIIIDRQSGLPVILTLQSWLEK